MGRWSCRVGRGFRRTFLGRRWVLGKGGWESGGGLRCVGALRRNFLEREERESIELTTRLG